MLHQASGYHTLCMLSINTSNQTVRWYWIGAIAVPAAKNTIFENHPKDILCNKNHLYKIILVHLASNIVFTTRKHFQADGY